MAVTTPVAFTLLESTTEGDVSAALKTAGKVTYETESIGVLAVSKVAMVTPVVAAAAAAAFLRPANWHTIDVAVAIAGFVTLSTKVFEPDNEAAPTERPIQARVLVG